MKTSLTDRVGGIEEKMIDKHFRTICIVLGLLMLGFVLHIAKPIREAAPPTSVATFPPTPAPLDKVWSPEQYRDFVNQVIANCRLPHGDRDRPSVTICGY